MHMHTVGTAAVNIGVEVSVIPYVAHNVTLLRYHQCYIEYHGQK